MKKLAAILGILVLIGLAALAQEASEAEDSGFVLNFIESRLSAPGRDIRLSGVSGALSSQARIARITVSDARGPWLEIEDVMLDWNRLALLRGRLNVNTLSAGRVAWLRRGEMPPRSPLPEQAEARPFTLPELPVSIDLQELRLDSVSFDQQIFGKAAELAATGSFSLADGALASALDIRRLDDPGGALELEAAFSNLTRQLALDVDLSEPQGGLIATLLKIENEPAIRLALEGSGPLEQVDVTFALDAANERIADGLVALRARDEGLGFDVDFSGELAPVIPAAYRDFFAGESSVQVRGVNKSAGGLRIDTLGIDGAVLQLDGTLDTGADGFLRALTLDGTLGDPAGPPVLLPVPGAETRLQSATLHVDYGDASRWDGLVELDRLEAADIGVEDVTLRLGGLAQNLDDPAARNVTVTVEGLATGVGSDDPRVDRALGDRIDLFVDAALPPEAPIELNQVQISGNGLSIFSAGSIEDLVYTGRNSVRVADLAIFVELAGRPLSGAVDIEANGTVAPLSGGFDLTFDGGTTDLAIGDERLDGLLAGATAISGRAVRDEQGIRTENLRIENPQLSFASDGQYSSRRTDIGFDAALSDLALVDPRLSGPLSATGRARGTGGPIDVSVSASIPSGSLAERTLTDASVGFDGRIDGRDVTGSLEGGGELDGLAMDLAGEISLQGDDRSLSGLVLAVGPNRLTGDLAKSGTAPAVGRLALDAPDISSLAALALVEASGSIDADIELDAAEVGQGVRLAAQARDLVLGPNRIAELDADAAIADALGLPLIDGEVRAGDLALGGIEVSSLTATADQVDPNRMDFAADARLAIGTLADLSGQLERLDDGFAATLDALRLRQQDVTATLAEPATVTLRGGAVELTPLRLDFRDGSLTAQGRMDESFDLDVAIEDLPLALANTIRPDLGLAGRIDGTARITGPRGQPDVRFEIAAADLAAATTRNAGLPPVALDATGATADGRLNLDATLGAADGLAARARGSVPLGAGELDLAVDLQSFPLALIDRVAGNQGLQGTVTGQAEITGPLSDPAATFDLRGERLSARVLGQSGVPPLGLTAQGDYRAQTVTLAAAQITGGGGIDLRGSGAIPLAGPGLDARVSGTAPLAMVNPLLADRGAQAAGQVRINATARGSLATPELGGTVALAGGTFADPGSNLRLEAIALDAALAGRTATLSAFRAEVATGGSIAAEGSVVIDGAAGFPSDLGLNLNEVRYTDGTFVSTQLSGTLALNGPVTRPGGVVSGRIGIVSGRIDLGRTEISVAEALGANAAAALEEVQHRSTPAPVQQTLDRARVGVPETTEPEDRGPGIGLDVQINAPNQIFVRGRGLDVELGGGLRVQGTTTDVHPVGQFELRRGRLNVLGQRIDFDEGSLQLVGNLDPQLYFVARTQSEDVTAIVTVQGRVSDPEIIFSSEPQLPQDEVLARVLFNRATENLSAFQLAQLAAAAAELAGGGGPGILSQLRGATGLDDLDIVTEESGATAVRAGKYIEDNIYLDVQTDTEGTARAAINLDITEQVTARGSVGSDGDTEIGIFYERDY